MGIIVNEECDYILRNLNAIDALFESYELAEKHIPIWLQKETCTYFEKRIEQLSLFEKLEWNVDISGYELLFTPKSARFFASEFYAEKPLGLCVGISNFNWNELRAVDTTDGMWIYLYRYMPAVKRAPKKSETLVNWRNSIDKQIKDTTASLKKAYQIFPVKEDPNILLAYYIQDIVNTEQLAKDEGTMLANLFKRVDQFIQDCRPVLCMPIE